jgi:gamma-glutamyl hydrolase
LKASLYAKLPDAKYNLALENHMYGMPPYMYEKYPILSEWYTIISTTKDRNGTEYVSSMEGKKMPFFGEEDSGDLPIFKGCSRTCMVKPV